MSANISFKYYYFILTFTLQSFLCSHAALKEFTSFCSCTDENDILNYILKNFNKTKGFLAGDKTVITELFHPKNEDIDLPYSLAFGELGVYKESLAHTLENAELYVFLEGTGILNVEGDKIDVSKGQTVLVLAGKTQYLKNSGDSSLKFLCIVSPPWSEDEEHVLE